MWIAALLLIARFAPNTHQIMANFDPAIDTYRGGDTFAASSWFKWRPSLPWALSCAALTLSAVIGLTRVSEFLYFQF